MDKQRFLEAFLKAKADEGNDYLTKEQFVAALKEVNYSEEQIELECETCDVNGDGNFKVEEIMKRNKYLFTRSAENTLVILKSWDENGDKKFDKSEMGQVLDAIYPGGSMADFVGDFMDMYAGDDGKVDFKVVAGFMNPDGTAENTSAEESQPSNQGEEAQQSNQGQGEESQQQQGDQGQESQQSNQEEETQQSQGQAPDTQQSSEQCPATDAQQSSEGKEAEPQKSNKDQGKETEESNKGQGKETQQGTKKSGSCTLI